MAPSLKYPSNARSFFTDRETLSIGGGIVLWRGYFQSVRPSINKLLINIDISTGAMYEPGEFISLALNFLGKSRQPKALDPSYGFPSRERVHLQQFVAGMKVTTPYRAHDPDRHRVLRGVTLESARNRTFVIDSGETMTIMEYFQNQMNIPLQYPDLICIEVGRCFYFLLGSHTL
jgi:eukaryotic translation initiation factor 2C